jgi:general secretion pathway protein K
MSVRAPASRQRGVALIIALVLMALATILAVKIGFGGYVERKRTTSMLAAEQAYQFAMGAEALAADVLSQNTSNTDDFSQPWAQVPQPIPLRPPNDPEGEPLGTLEGSLEDMTGRFNINNLRRTLPDGSPDPQPLEQFRRILEALNLEPKWAQLARDWIDADNNPDFPEGAEDSVYLSQSPPYRTANWPMQSTTELLSLPGFGVERYQKLAPYVTALPTRDAKINVCTASGLILDSLTLNQRLFSGNPDALIKGRKSGCFPDLATLKNQVSPTDWDGMKDQVVQKTDYFRLTTIVTLGSTEFTLYSLLWRNSSKKATPILRSFGTP